MASRSPSSASGEAPMSKPVMATTPPNAMPSPTRTCQRCLTPRNSCMTAIQADCRQTRAVAAATEVSCREVMKQAKCKASATAAMSDQRNSLPVMRPNCARLPTSGGSGHDRGTDRVAPEGDGQGAHRVAPSVAAMRGPEEATPRTPRAARKKITVPP